MSRSGYSDDCGGSAYELWRNSVERAIRGKRGQAFLAEMAAAMDAMPEKVLIADELQDQEGAVCAIGCVGVAREIDMTKIDPEEPEQVANAFGIARALVQEIEYINDEGGYPSETPQRRFERVRKWLDASLARPARR